ncbi:hypothetical protein [Nocardioides plantarum]
MVNLPLAIGYSLNQPWPVSFTVRTTRGVRPADLVFDPTTAC